MVMIHSLNHAKEVVDMGVEAGRRLWTLTRAEAASSRAQQKTVFTADFQRVTSSQGTRRSKFTGSQRVVRGTGASSLPGNLPKCGITGSTSDISHWVGNLVSHVLKLSG